MNLFTSFRIVPLFLFLITSIFVKPLSASTDSNPIDSLKQALINHPGEDTIRAKIFLELAKLWYPKNLDSMAKYNELAFIMSEKTSFNNGLMRSWNGKALVNWRKQQFQEAISDFHKAMTYGIMEQDNDYLSIITNNIGVLYGNLGSVDSAIKYDEFAIAYGIRANNPQRVAKAKMDLSGLAGYKGDHAGAIRNLLDAQKIYETVQNQEELSRVYLRLGIQYANLRDFPSSRYYYKKTEWVMDSLENMTVKQSLLNNLGYLYYQVKKDYDSARHFLYQAKALAEEMQDQHSIMVSNLNIGNTFSEEKNNAEAMRYYQLVMESSQFEYQNQVKAAVWVNLGAIYYMRGEINKAKQYTQKGLELSKENHFLEFQMNACNTLSGIHEALGHFSLALDYKKQASMLSDSIWNQEIADRVLSLEFQHELDKKETENQLLIKENEVKQGVITRQWIIIAGGCIILVLLVLLTIVVLRSRNKLSALNHLLDENNRQLTVANQTKDRFFSIVAHDLRSPFNALSGLLAELDEHYTDYDETAKKQIITSLRKSTQNTYNLLNNLLDWAQSQRDRLANNPEPLQLLPLTEEVFELLKTRAELKSLNLFNTIDPSLRMVADPHLLKSILINLINNAIKFTPRDGRIDVSATLKNQRVQICIQDTGIGIPEDQLGHLFRIDTSFNRTGTENESGTGLGLVMCKEYVEIMGGSITVNSHEGEGSVFCIALPQK